MTLQKFTSVLLLCSLILESNAFLGQSSSMARPTFIQPQTQPSSSSSSSSSSRLYDGNIEQIEFKIYPDGRIEETVRGIKGGECHKVTDEINVHLGKVVESKPTEEMYEQEIVLDNTISVNEQDNSSSGGWEGASSW